MHERSSSVRVPHFDLPFHFADQGLGYPTAVVVEQDSDEEVAVCVETILRFEPGSRLEKPDFGTTDQAFSSPSPDANEYIRAISEYEPRAAVTLEESPDAYDELVSRVRVTLSRVNTEEEVE